MACIRKKAPPYFEDMPSLRDVIGQLKAADAGPTPGSDPVFRENVAGWPERWMLKKILETYGLMPITTDSHSGEYPAWAHDAVDHKGVLDVCDIYRQYVPEKKTRDRAPTARESRSRYRRHTHRLPTRATRKPPSICPTGVSLRICRTGSQSKCRRQSTAGGFMVYRWGRCPKALQDFFTTRSPFTI